MSADIFLAGTRVPTLRRMTSTPDLRPQRAALLQRLLPDGVPTLWCPLLTRVAPAIPAIGVAKARSEVVVPSP